MRFSCFFFTLLPPFSHIVNAERKLPADLQVDLIFPRDNETYAPTQVLPIVFGINNIDLVWPLDLSLSVEVQSLPARSNESAPFNWQYEIVRLRTDEFIEAVGPAPGRQFFYFPAVNMTTLANGTDENFRVLWTLAMPNQCFANSTDPLSDDGKPGWTSTNGYGSHAVWFSMAPGGQRPDVEAATNSCSEAGQDTSAAVRITQVKKTYFQEEICPVLETGVNSTKCVFQSVARELAANVSAAMMEKLRCEEGEWQTITKRCPWKPKKKSAAPPKYVFEMSWALLALCFAVLDAL